MITQQFIDDAMRFKTMPHGPARAAAFAALNRKYPAAVPRGYLGRLADESVELALSDKAGQVRARLVVKEDGESALEFLDENGKVLRTISGAEGK